MILTNFQSVLPVNAAVFPQQPVGEQNSSRRVLWILDVDCDPGLPACLSLS